MITPHRNMPGERYSHVRQACPKYQAMPEREHPPISPAAGTRCVRLHLVTSSLHPGYQARRRLLDYKPQQVYTA